MQDISLFISHFLLTYQEAMQGLVQGYRETTMNEDFEFEDKSTVK